MIGLVRGELGGFMSQRDLTAYLANTSQPERDRALRQEDAYVEQARKLLSPNDPPPEPQDVPPVPEFTPRHKVTDLFREFTDKFTNNARDRGVTLRWIGVGTWKTPINNVFDKHLEAWKLSRENEGMGSEDAMQGYEAEIGLKKLLVFVRDVPILAYRKISGATKPADDPAKSASQKGADDSASKNESSEKTVTNILSSLLRSDKPKAIAHKDAMKLLLLEYRQLLIEAAEFIQAKNERVPDNILQGIQKVEIALNIIHWVGKNGPRTI